jgi:polyhydroxyalkanoate synthesis regulator phasin
MESPMATTTKRRKNSVTKFLQDVIDDSKELVDDLIDRARDVEEHTHDAVRDVVDDEDEDTTPPSSEELAELKSAIAALSKKVDKLAAVTA